METLRGGNLGRKLEAAERSAREVVCGRGRSFETRSSHFLYLGRKVRPLPSRPLKPVPVACRGRRALRGCSLDPRARYCPAAPKWRPRLPLAEPREASQAEGWRGRLRFRRGRRVLASTLRGGSGQEREGRGRQAPWPSRPSWRPLHAHTLGDLLLGAACPVRVEAPARVARVSRGEPRGKSSGSPPGVQRTKDQGSDLPPLKEVGGAPAGGQQSRQVCPHGQAVVPKVANPRQPPRSRHRCNLHQVCPHCARCARLPSQTTLLAA
ncbi:uncharacterized protein AAEQ78_003939 [Lycaon pictus]